MKDDETPQAIDSFFVESPDVESSTDDYARRFSGPIGQYFLEVQATAVLGMLRWFPNSTVLDVGGGHAQLAAPLAAQGYDVTVLGSRPECRQRLESNIVAGQIEFQTGNLLQMPFADKSFDVVIAFRMLPHFSQWRKLVEECCRVSCGMVIVDYPDLRSFNMFSGVFFRAKKSVEGNARPFRCFRNREVSSQLAAHGFGVHEVYRQFFFPMALHRILGRAGLSRGVEVVCRHLGLTTLFGSPAIVSADSRRVLVESP